MFAWKEYFSFIPEFQPESLEFQGNTKRLRLARLPSPDEESTLGSHVTESDRSNTMRTGSRQPDDNMPTPYANSGQVKEKKCSYIHCSSCRNFLSQKDTRTVAISFECLIFF